MLVIITIIFAQLYSRQKVDDAEQMYNHHLKQFDQFWMSILPRFFMAEDPKFDFLLILAQYGLDWRVNLNSVQEGMQAETLVIEFYNEGKVPSFPGSEKSMYDPYCREKYSIDGTKYATIPLLCCG
jgi:hypothetical protein